ncbi:MAG: glycoside hydrolase family 3 N-terminal domain-containing protein [Pricia sp.]
MLKVIPYKKATKNLTTRGKVGQLFMPAAFINDTESEIQKLEKLIREHKIGSLCFFHSRASAATNFEGAKAIVHNENSFETLKSLVQRYQRAAEYPLLIAIDAEWGLAMRIENTPQYPYAITLGALSDDASELIYEVGKHIAKDCREAGIHWNLAPCVDINDNPHNPVIGYRSFGANKHKVIAKALAYIKGTQSEGVLTSIKHFPGHGDTATDSHLALPLIDKSREDLFENELYPFYKLIAECVDSVMVGHLSVPALANGASISSSISKEIIKGILRDEMGYRGVVISDALNMHAVSKNYPVKGELEWLAFDAGNDVLCFAEHIAEGIEAILKKASEEQIEESFERVWKLKEKVQASSSLEQGIPETESVDEESFEKKSLDAGFLDSEFLGKKSSEEEALNLESFEVGTLQRDKASGTPNRRSDLTAGLQNPDALNKKIALESLTLLKGSVALISDFRKTNFVAIQINETTDNQFFKHIHKNIKFRPILSNDPLKGDVKNILLALFPPQVKPTNTFGFSKEELIFIDELIQTKNVVLYLFGNPYVLNHIDTKNAKAVVVVHQDFDVFQETAAAHFLGNLVAKGRLAVTIESNTKNHENP